MEAEFDKWLESDEHTECEEKLRKVNRSNVNLRKVVSDQKFKLERLGVQYSRAVEKIEHLRVTTVPSVLANKFAKERDQKDKIIEGLQLQLATRTNELKLAKITIEQTSGWAALSMGDSMELHR